MGNGKNLCLTPPSRFGYPAFGMNTVHLYEGWKPTYYTAVDQRVQYEFGEAIVGKFAEIPKFIPRPNLDRWEGPNFHRFYHRPGPLQADDSPDALERGIVFSNVMHVAMQLAYFMGFTTLLMIGVEHQPQNPRGHFWGTDSGITEAPDLTRWFEDYRVLREGMRGVRVLNISENTFVPEDVLPRDNWRRWITDENSQIPDGLPGPRDARAVLSQG